MPAIRSNCLRTLPQLTRTISNSHKAPTMSLFQEFSPIFRLVNDYERAARCAPREARFTPRFDVKELKDSYELQGELPGIDQKDVSIEWTDATTLVIKGRSEHRSQRGTPAQKASETAAPETTESDSASTKDHEYKAPSVEEEDGSTTATDDFVDVASPAVQEETITKKAEETVAPKPAEQGRYWISERSVGTFGRSFTFPVRIDQDNVKASLKNGILSVVIPKLVAPPRKITIE